MQYMENSNRTKTDSAHKFRLAGLRLAKNLVLAVIGFFTILWLISLFVPQGPSIESATRAIEDHGYSNVENVQQHWLGSHLTYGCDSKDAYAFTASAINPAGRRVNLTACTGYYFKGYTIRMSR
jgi:hypothetical protein